MNPFISALITALANAVAVSVNDVLKTYLERKDITDIEKQKATIISQGFVIAGQQWAIRALLNPDQHDQLQNLGGKLEPIIPSGAASTPVQPGVPT